MLMIREGCNSSNCLSGCEDRGYVGDRYDQMDTTLEQGVKEMMGFMGTSVFGLRLALGPFWSILLLGRRIELG